MSQSKIHDLVLDDLSDRESWEQKQRIWYQMRHNGLRRKNKPYPHAADLHFPLIDGQIRQFKPFYINQVWSGELLANFTHLRGDRQLANLSAQRLHWEIKNRTNFSHEIHYLVDAMLLRGRGIFKTVWDPFKQRIEYVSVEPLNLIVPKTANEIEDADRFTHVRIETVESFRRDRRYNQDAKSDEVITLLTGRPNDHDGGDMETAKAVREGLTFTHHKDEIVVWEVYEKTPGGWTIYTYCPTNPDIRIRQSMGVVYKWGNETLCPFVSFPFERKDKGWYSPRGLAELQAANETYLSKLWNTKCDSLDFTSKPLFRGKGGMDGNAKITFNPGEIFPEGIEPVQFPKPAMSIDQEMMQTRMIAEQLVAAPDLNGGSREQSGDTKKTAREVEARMALMNQGISMNGRLFREDLAKVYKLTWAIMLQFQDKIGRDFVVDGEVQALPDKALSHDYEIAPEGSPDDWHPQMRLQRGQQRLALWKGHPNINQAELAKTTLEDDDPALVKRLHVDDAQRSATQAEEQASEIVIMKEGFPAAVTENDDHQIHATTLIQYLEKEDMAGAPVDPRAQEVMQQHLALHLQYLGKQNPQAAREVQGQLQQMVQQSAQREQMAAANPQQPVNQPPSIDGMQERIIA
ncbi:MAG: hypothetical protein AAFX93_14100 [Verrucomicrobiota bacterium]